jgi:predicted nucleic acid-binding protein
MKKIFIDTNIVIDLLSCREPYYKESAVLFSLADRKKVEISISSLTIANTSYVLLNQLKTNK